MGCPEEFPGAAGPIPAVACLCNQSESLCSLLRRQADAIGPVPVLRFPAWISISLSSQSRFRVDSASQPMATALWSAGSAVRLASSKRCWLPRSRAVASATSKRTVGSVAVGRKHGRFSQNLRG